MSYKVLYRKYRPISFDEIIGQKKIVNILRKSIELDKTAHAYIFTGMRGTGKTSMAHIFAKAINCLSPIKGNACDNCVNCKSIENSPDIIEIDAASNNSVDNIRELIENSRLVPSFMKYKVYIIDEVHMLSTGAFNALLKTLEEPAKHIKFILATTEIQKVPITILSRCQRFDFYKIDYEEITNHILDISSKEKIKIQKEAANEIAFLSDGSIRDSLSLLDQLSNIKEEISLKIIEESFGTLSNKKIKDFINIINTGNLNSIHDKIDEFRKEGVDPVILITKMLHIYKDMILDDIKKNNNNYNTYKNIIINLSEKLNLIKNSYDPLLIFELTIMDNLPLEENISKDSMNKNEENIINIQEEKKPINASKDNEKPVDQKNYVEKFDELNKIRLNNCFVNASKEYKDASIKKWEKFVKEIQEKDLSLYSVVENCEVEASSEKIIVLSIENISTCRLLNKKMFEIEKSFNKVNKSEYSLCFLTKKDWDERKKEYITNYKNKQTYKIIEEPTIEIIESDEITEQAKELFGEESVDLR